MGLDPKLAHTFLSQTKGFGCEVRTWYNIHFCRAEVFGKSFL